jgi:transposase InsO family protein
MPAAFKHFNEIHPHSSLGYKSPSMYREELMRRAQIGVN